jgi:tRNA pseudouridine38-40 synthase
MVRYFIHLAYKGTNYHGWQIQPNACSIQELIQESLKILLKTDIKLIGCGRTDTGVHARNFYAHFDFNLLEKSQLSQLVYKLNQILPKDILIYHIFRVENTTHSRFDAISRTYKYYISDKKEIFMHDYVWQCYASLNINKMNEASSLLKKYTDFTSFSKLHTDVKTNNCRISKAVWTKEENLIIFTISADRFLRNMVRSIVGTLIDVGKEKMTKNEFCNVIESRNRGAAGTSVPAKGLFLESIQYPSKI